MDRFGITEDSLWAAFQERQAEGDISRAEFEDRLDHIKTDNTLVTYTSLYAHLLDQLDWELLSPEEAWEAGTQMLCLAGLQEEMTEKESLVQPGEREACICRMAEQYLERLINRIINYS